MPQPDNRQAILDQFTRQAVPFSTAPGIRDEEALRLLVTASGAGPADSVLDVACGPGLVVAAFARVARHVTGIDLTPAMIDRARALVRERGLANVTLTVGDVRPLPYEDGAFSLVVSRFAFHHFPDPGAVLREMVRVCAPGAAWWWRTRRSRRIPRGPPRSTGWRRCGTPRTRAPCPSPS